MKKNIDKQFEKSLITYIIGFILSIVLTVGAYYMVVNHNSILTEVNVWVVALVIAGIAIIQFLVQIFFFMHLRMRTKPNWRFVVFLYMILVMIILVGGSLWIMKSLKGRMVMNQNEVSQYMQNQIGF